MCVCVCVLEPKQEKEVLHLLSASYVPGILYTLFLYEVGTITIPILQMM